MEMSWKTVELVIGWANDNAVWIAIVAALAIVAAKSTLGEKRMAHWARIRHIEQQFAYDITDRIEDRVADGDYTRADAKHLYAKIRRLFPTLSELAPSPELLKEKIDNRLGKHTEPDLPDAKAPKVMKHMFDVPGFKVSQRVVL